MGEKSAMRTGWIIEDCSLARKFIYRAVHLLGSFRHNWSSLDRVKLRVEALGVRPRQRNGFYAEWWAKGSTTACTQSQVNQSEVHTAYAAVSKDFFFFFNVGKSGSGL